ncbi:MAG: hypothetical protein V4792_12560 [Pseudomonadota bacterium]
MPEQRGSLLGFAIAASVAILPIMLGVVLFVAKVHPAESDDMVRRPGAQRYVSVRHVAALKTFEAAIAPRAGLAAPPPSAQQVLDGLPRCRPEWVAGWRAADWLPRLSGIGTAPPSPAELIAAQLAALDAALLRFGSRPNARVSQPVGLDAVRWFSLADEALGRAIKTPDYPERQFHLRCSDLTAALAALLHADARMLDSLAWRGSEGSTVLARWRPDQMSEISAHHVARRNPWQGVPGCVYLGAQTGVNGPLAPSHFVAGPRSVQRRLCNAFEGNGAAAAAVSAPVALVGEPGVADPVDDTRWMVPPSLHTMLQPLEPLRQPSGALYRLYTDAGPEALPGVATSGSAPKRIVLNGAAIDMGLSIALTIDPALQALAQRTAACYTGRHDVCRALGLRRHDDKAQSIGQALLEGAMVRMAAVAVIDVASGRIEALAGARSRCARQEVDGPGRDASCDTRLPYPIQYRPDALLNPAVFHDAMPASTVKPIMAAAFLSDPEVGARWLAAERSAMQRDAAPARESLRGQLLRSDSARFLDRMFCLDKGPGPCERPWAVQAAASAFGWNAGCAEAPGRHADCGKHDLLFGRPIDDPGAPTSVRAPGLAVAYGRLMSQPQGGQLGAAMRLMPRAALDPGIVRRCAAGVDGRRVSDDDWEKCRGGAVVDVVAEGWGQGHARASALGIAGMMASLAAAANGQTELLRPHLVESLHAAGGGAPPLALAADLAQWRRAAQQPNRLAPQAAEVILSGLSYSHRSGTARTACEQVFDAQRCRDIGWLAGKTGTPSFPNDGISLDELARLCPGGVAAAHTKPGTCSSLRPYKWYVAAYRTDQSSIGPWTKVIAVLTERNWLQRNGQIHGAGDHGPNPSAEIALQIAGHQLGLLAGAAP